MRSVGLMIALLVPCAVLAQPAPAGEAERAARAEERPEFRDLTGYRFPPPAQTVRDMQNVAQAILLRDYCADARVSDDFVKERLALFSRITGRQETCRSLLDY